MAVFNHLKFGTIRAMAINGDAWLAGVDVAEALGYRHPEAALMKYVGEEDRRVIQRSDGAPFAVPRDGLTLINVAGVHALIHYSEHPKAMKFKRWIMDDVVSPLRKHGGYISSQETMSSEELMAAALVCADKKIKERDLQIANLTAQNQIMQPKADYFDELVERNTLTSFRETAKKLGVKKDEFIRYLLDASYVYRDKEGKLQPNADKNVGLFEMKGCYSGTQTFITPKGRETFRLLCRGLMEQ